MLTAATWLTSSCFFLLKPGNGFCLEEMYLFIKASAHLISDFFVSLPLLSESDSELPAHQNYLKAALKDILEVLGKSSIFQPSSFQEISCFIVCLSHSKHLYPLWIIWTSGKMEFPGSLYSFSSLLFSFLLGNNSDCLCLFLS